MIDTKNTLFISEFKSQKISQKIDGKNVMLKFETSKMQTNRN